MSPVNRNEPDHDGLEIPSDVPTVTPEWVTPEKAFAYLKSAPYNRPPVKATAVAYAREMRAGKWQLTCEPIKFDINGKMQDGQNRCMAIILADIPVLMYVARGLRPEAFEVLDQNRRRTFAQMLGRKGVHNYSAVDGAVTRLEFFERKGELGPTGKPKATIQDLQAVFDRWQESEEYAAVGVRIGQARLLDKGLATALACVFSRADSEQAKQFMEDLAAGTGLAENDPIFALREALHRASTITAKNKIPTSRGLAMAVISTWNAVQEGRALTSVRFLKGGRFPQIVGYEYPPPPTRFREAVEFLAAKLEAAPLPEQAIRKAAEQAGIRDFDTVVRVRDAIDITVSEDGRWDASGAGIEDSLSRVADWLLERLQFGVTEESRIVKAANKSGHAELLDAARAVLKVEVGTIPMPGGRESTEWILPPVGAAE